MTAAESLLCELVALPSVNPALLPPGDPRSGEHRVTDYVAARAARAGLDVDFAEVLPGRRNLMARLAPAGSCRSRVLLAPHADTVGNPGLSDRSFRPTVRNGRLHGRGACDTKGSVAAMLAALMELAERGPRPAHTEVVLALLVDEEQDQSGSRFLARQRFKADLAIVGEPTQLKVLAAHKGVCWTTVETRGRAAHGARPELGRNAIHAMSRVVEVIETHYARLLKKRRHALLGQPTVNVGMVRGGTQANIVPDQCMALVDRRTIPGETDGQVFRELRALLRKHGSPALLRASHPGKECLPMETDARLPLVRELMHHAGQRSPAGAHFFSDASVLSHGGIPSVLFGPGNIDQAHTADEWIALKSLRRATEILSSFLRALP
jgi:acetylornithine deacetylase/succinyl-diaminopimelate desuccinylase-like protein